VSAREATPEAAPEPHGIARSIALHLLPGVPISLAYYALVPWVEREGLPSVFALVADFALFGVPLLLGILLFAGRARHGRASLAGVVLYREPLTAGLLLRWGPLLLAWAIACFLVVGPSAVPPLRDGLFGFVPPAFVIDDGPPAVPRMELLTLLLVLLSNDLVSPAVEELYFRGWLLPRMQRFGAAAPFVNALLFVLYHGWSPWLFVPRVLALAPFTYAVWRTRCLGLAIVVHCTLNVLSTLSVWAPALAAAPPG
jgi:hypothetical protein